MADQHRSRQRAPDLLGYVVPRQTGDQDDLDSHEVSLTEMIVVSNAGPVLAWPSSRTLDSTEQQPASPSLEADMNQRWMKVTAAVIAAAVALSALYYLVASF
ncbi:hypothetical protein GCM10011609_28760 [Lentzea pudingi]|uniref:Uncharacterized protein n=1 Tax=Lentzea pudingi TaxID=1789439 RepID=A0ABQ2HT74_9PSEU|nr:hypothetical protein GCM10011609_28760 [Lentzea pudingi]